MNRVLWIDLIRVVGAFLVIAIHVCGRVVGGYAVHDSDADFSGTLGWLVARCIQYLSSSVAVPLFIMVSGALLLGRHEEAILFYRKRFSKILLPFFAWSCVFIFCLWIAGRSLNDGTPITLFNAVGALLSGNVSGHFWFMYLLISLYMIAPFLSVFVRHASKNMLTCFLVIWFCATVIFPFCNNIAKTTLGITDIYFHSFQFAFGFHWIGLFVAGYFLKDCLIPKWWAVIGIGILFYLGMAVPINMYLLKVYPDSSLTFPLVCMQKYLFPIISHQATLSLIAFLALRSLGDIPSLESSRLGRMVIHTAPLTFGIYLCHHIILIPTMGVLDKILGLGSCESWIVVLCAVPTLTVFFYFTAAGLVYLIRQNQYLKFCFAP